MKKYLIEAVYNTPEYAIETGGNYRETIEVYQTNYENIQLNIETRYYSVDESGNEHECYDPTGESIIVTGPVWELIYEDIERCYPAIHAYAVGHNGSHLNYMEINFKGEINE